MLKKITGRIYLLIKSNIFPLLSVFLALEILGLGFIQFYPTYKLKQNVNALNNSEITIELLEDWLKSYALVSGEKPSGSIINNEVVLVESMQKYNETLESYNGKALIKLPEIKLGSVKYLTRDLEPSVIYSSSDKLPQGEKIILDPGEKIKQSEIHLEINGRIIQLVTNTEDAKKPMTVLFGDTNRTNFVDELKAELLSIQSGDEERTFKHFNNEQKGFAVLQSLEFQDVYIDFKPGDSFEAGHIDYLDEKCSSLYSLKFSYVAESNNYEINDLADFKLKDCSLVPVYNPIATKMLTCTDCKYAPVDKTNFLPNTYTPNLKATNLPGGGMLTAETVEALTKMSEAIQAEGSAIHITSAYRSYQEQQQAFNYWVNREIAKGANIQTARLRANIYSAYPGHSEHQLGTTLDIRCQQCDAFSKDIASNPVYQFLEKHAHEYGFVISYPEGKQHLTGYTYEPWHIRYVGVELATELFNRDYQNINNNEYLTKFLREIGLY